MSRSKQTLRLRLEELEQRNAPSFAGLMNALDHIPDQMVAGGGQAIVHVMTNLEAQGGSAGAANAAMPAQQNIVITKTTDPASPNLMSFSWGATNPTGAVRSGPEVFAKNLYVGN